MASDSESPLAAPPPNDAAALLAQGNALYAQGKLSEAIAQWEKAVRVDGTLVAGWRNLGIGYHHAFHDLAAARGSYERALRLAFAASGVVGEQASHTAARRTVAGVLFERDRLWRSARQKPADRLAGLELFADLFEGQGPEHDALVASYCELLNIHSQHEAAQRALMGRHSNAELGRGDPLLERQIERTQIGVARRLFWQNRAADALAILDTQFTALAQSEEHPGIHDPASAPSRSTHANGFAMEARPLATELHYWAGLTAGRAGDESARNHHFTQAADLHPTGLASVYAALALRELGLGDESRGRFEEMLQHADVLRAAPVAPAADPLESLALFEDPAQERDCLAGLIEGVARWGVGEKRVGRRIVGDVLRDQPNHAGASDIMEWIDWE